MSQVIALPNGSLHDATISLLAKVGIRILVRGRKFDCRVEGSDIFDSAIIMRPQDMSEALVDGMVDVAIYGKDWFFEAGLIDELRIIAELNYAKRTSQPAKVVVFGKQDEQEELVDHEGTLVTTEYPRLTRQVFTKATLRFSHGGTEQKVAYGKYHYGVGITEGGDSIADNDLKILKIILVSPVVLVAREETPELKHFGELLSGGLEAERYRLLKMNIRPELLDPALKVLPALGKPTISRQSNGEFAVETVVGQDQVTSLIITLKLLGVTGILVQKLEVMC